MLAIVEAIAKFRHYLLGHKFIIKTDQKSLRSLMEQPLQTPEQQEWLHRFLGYDCVIEYKARKENLAADSLSRMMMLSWSEPQASILQKIEQATIKNVALQELIQLCKQQPESQTNYTIKGNLLYWKNRVVIPEEKELIQMLLKEFHNSPIGGMLG